MNNTYHWAFPLIGKPYQLGAQGPDAFDCWGLVRWAFVNHLGVPDMPAIDVGSTQNLLAIRHAAGVSGWHPIADKKPKVNDVALMDSIDGKHVGIVARANGGLGLVHAYELAGVTFTALNDLKYLGFKNFSYWRKSV